MGYLMGFAYAGIGLIPLIIVITVVCLIIKQIFRK